jgi:hypothetical protein
MHLKIVTNSTNWYNFILTKNKICKFANLDPSPPTNTDLIRLRNIVNRPTVNKHDAAAAAVAIVYKKTSYVIEIEEIPNVNDLQLLQFHYIQGCW